MGLSLVNDYPNRLSQRCHGAEETHTSGAPQLMPTLLLHVRYICLVPFSFLILIGRFATPEA